MAMPPEELKNFRIFSGIAEKGVSREICLRKFDVRGEEYLLLVNPNTLTTKVAQAKQYRVKALKPADIRLKFANSPYVKAINLALKTDRQLQNAGIDHAIPKTQGISLTIDLCPSHKVLDRRIFKALMDSYTCEVPIPLAISVSGRWLEKHGNDLKWLQELVRQGIFKITWINHSFNHEVNTLPLRENFLLSKGVDLNEEVLSNERLMLELGLLPSVFFRFPGLVSDLEEVKKVSDFGLIPVGSDAWLAKGEAAKAGSIVLIHGNGNEPIGVDDFLDLLKKERASLERKQWLLFDLGEGLVREFNP